MYQDHNWNGLILHLYRQVDSSIFPANALDTRQGVPNQTYMAFGNFDRLCFTPVNSFVDYLKRADSAYQWIGGHKDIMLYPIKESTSHGRHFTFKENPQSHSCVFDFIEGNTRQFIVLTMLYLSDKIKSRFPSYEELLSKCSKQVRNIVNQYNELAGLQESPVFFDLFGTFNSAEIGILWGTNQFTDVEFIVDQIRYFSLQFEDGAADPMFTASYSVVSCYDSTSIINVQLNGTAYIQLSTGSYRDPNIAPSKLSSTQYLSKLQNCVHATSPDAVFTINSCAGEYDHIICSHPPQLQMLTQHTGNSYGALHRKNPNFSSYFANSTTRLAYSDDDICEAAINFPWHEYLNIHVSNNGTSQCSPLWNGNRVLCHADKAYRNYSTLLQQSITSVSSLSTNVALLYEDFTRAANATSDRQWAYDLEVQVNAAFNILSQFKNPNDPTKLLVDRDYIERSEILLQRLRQQIHHITEAGKLSFDEPSLHIASTVEYDLLFHMFYGAIKDILRCIYDRTSGKTQSTQSTLIPLIQFELTPIVKSALYHDIPDIHDRIVDISIPYDAWGEPNIYIPYLIHELYHYVAPYNRDLRNDIFAKFIITEIIVKSFQCMVMQKYDTYIAAKFATEQNSVDLTPNADSHIQHDVFRSNVESALAAISDELRKCIFNTIKQANISSLIIEEATQIGDDSPDFQELLNNIDSGNCSWRIYEAILLSWLGGDNGYNNTEFSKLVISSLKRAIQSMAPHHNVSPKKDFIGGFEACANNLDACKDYIFTILVDDCLDSDDHSPTLDLFEHLQINSQFWIYDIITQLREILPDQAMTELTQMGVSEYLFIFSLSQEKLFNTQETLEMYDHHLPIRIGYIIDQLLGSTQDSPEDRMNAFQRYRNDFVDLYSSYMEFCTWNNTVIDEHRKVAIVESANRWFEMFSLQLSDYYAIYCCYHEMFQELSHELYKPLLHSLSSNRLQTSTRCFYAALRSRNSASVFESNLNAIWAFQTQEFLSELSIDVAPDLSHSSRRFGITASATTNTTNKPIRPYYIRRPIVRTDELYGTFDSILRDLSKAHQSAFGTGISRNGLWFRGSQNADFSILPSAMVHFVDSNLLKTHDQEKGCNAHGPLWKYQKNLLDRFKYQADGASEFVNSASYTMPDYIALMQHYQQNTCYLDWSEDAYSSLFFALEQYIMGETVKYPNADAALYILDPMLFNRARNLLVGEYVNGRNGSNLSPKWLRRQNQNLLKEDFGFIPNLSTAANLRYLNMYTLDLPGGFSYILRNKSHYHASSKSSPENVTLNDVEAELLNLPLAVHTSRLNPRIRTQSGQFIAYSPFALPVYGPDESDVDDPKKNDFVGAKRFSYLGLLQIQEFFLERFKGEAPFMYELTICAGAKADVANYLKSTGINRYRIYPELTHLKL